MQKQNYTHKIPLTGNQHQLELLKLEGHEGEVEVRRDNTGKVIGSELLCTVQHEPTANLAGNVEESFTRKPVLEKADYLLERMVGSTYPQEDMTIEESNRREGRYEHE